MENRKLPGLKGARQHSLEVQDPAEQGECGKGEADVKVMCG